MELSAFDLDFFEVSHLFFIVCIYDNYDHSLLRWQEIENLKYAHAEAVRKLKIYENMGSRGGRS